MAYCNLDDLKAAKDESTLKEIAGDGTTIDTDLVDKAIEAADGDIDGYLKKRYLVPLSTVDKIIKNISVQLALYRLYGCSNAIPDFEVSNKKEAIKKEDFRSILLPVIVKNVVGLDIY